MGNRNVVIVDYGLGNLHSVNKAVALVGGNPVITGDKEIIAAAEKLILPGVGAFGDCMANLEKAGVIPVIKEYIAADKPFRYCLKKAKKRRALKDWVCFRARLC